MYECLSSAPILSTAVPLETFVTEALYHPTKGYYANKTPIGQTADYITAPEICQVFGELLALWGIDKVQKTPVSSIHIIELGAGTGTLMADMLRIFNQFRSIIPSYTVHIIDCCPALIEQQRQKLAPYAEVCWHRDFSTIPAGYSLIFANEFFDALPVNQYIAVKGQWHQRLVCKNAQGFSYEVGLPVMCDLPIPYEGAIHETSNQSLYWMQQVCTRLKENQGAGLIIDYGDDLAPWIGDTLQAIYHHKKVNIFNYVGYADLTHHVDFNALKQVAQHAGLSPSP